MELDFVLQVGTEILPVEVKAEENVKSKSLRLFITVDNAGSIRQPLDSILVFRRTSTLSQRPKNKFFVFS